MNVYFSRGESARGRVCVQTADLDAAPQGTGAGGLGKERLTVEVVLAAAALPSPPPLVAFHPDPTDPALPALEDPTIAELLELLPRADVYLQDDVQLALHPTLTRVWCRRGRRGQRLVEAPGTNRRTLGFGAVDWREGWMDWAVADKRAADPCCAQLRRLIDRSYGLRQGVVMARRSARCTRRRSPGAHGTGRLHTVSVGTARHRRPRCRRAGDHDRRSRSNDRVANRIRRPTTRIRRSRPHERGPIWALWRRQHQGYRVFQGHLPR
jgi:hypothetical protein